MRPLLIVPVLALLTTLTVHAQQRSPIAVSELGPQIGERAPDFRLTDQSGTERTLQSIMGPRGTMLVFIRSADW